MTDTVKTSGTLALAPKVITIPAADRQRDRPLRVAAYCRVSSDSADQLHSFAAQNAYYAKRITDDPAWELADIYADRGITGTSIDRREDFLRMMEDCRKGRIDRILVKSISRFGRNTRESLETVRELKSLGISVYFEEQNIDTAKADGEMLTAIFATLAQKESESISEKMRWSYRTRMQRGEFLTCTAPYGYQLVNNTLVIREQEAETVRYIYRQYLAGQNSCEIAAALHKADPTFCWTPKRIDYILQNERYTGNALLQKKYTAESLPRKQRINHGEQPQYYVTDSHPAIIPEDTFGQAQALRKSRKVAQIRNDRPLRGKLFCACGTWCRHKLTRGTHYWLCRAHDMDKKHCDSQPIPESEIYQAFLCLYFKLKHHTDILTQLLSDLRTARQNSLLWSEDIVELNRHIADIASQERLLTQLRRQGTVNPDIFISRTDALAERRRELKRKKELLFRAEEDHTLRRTQELLDILTSSPDWLDSFDESLFQDIVEKIVIADSEHLRFRLINGLEVSDGLTWDSVYILSASSSPSRSPRGSSLINSSTEMDFVSSLPKRL